MRLSIIIPTLNEEQTIAQILQKVIEQDFLNWNKEIILVNDGSTDGTEKAVEPFLEKIHYIKHAANQGKGAAIKTALSAATGNAVIIQDADLEYDPGEIALLLNEFKNGTLVVYGSRNIRPKARGYPHYVLGVKILTGLVNLLYGQYLTDVYTGYKLIATPLLKSLNIVSRGFEFEAEVTCKILKKGIAIKEVRVEYYPRKFSEGKKIRFKDGLVGLWTILKNRFIIS